MPHPGIPGQPITLASANRNLGWRGIVLFHVVKHEHSQKVCTFLEGLSGIFNLCSRGGALGSLWGSWEAASIRRGPCSGKIRKPDGTR